MKLVLVSLDQAWENKHANCVKITRDFNTIVSCHPDLVIFPEMTLTAFTMNTSLGETFTESETIKFFTNLALSNKCCIGFGIIIKKEKLSSNNFIVTNAEGKIIGNYEKIHPFSYAKEDSFYVRGDKLGFAEINNVSFGLAVCYDLRFPELFQALSRKASVISIIANWPEKRVDHWISLLKARAIENQVFIVGVNRTGTDGNGLNYIKSSMIFSPAGKLIEPFRLAEGVDLYEINPSDSESFQKAFPVKKDRQNNLYKSFYEING